MEPSQAVVGSPKAEKINPQQETIASRRSLTQFLRIFNSFFFKHVSVSVTPWLATQTFHVRSSYRNPIGSKLLQVKLQVEHQKLD